MNSVDRPLVSVVIPTCNGADLVRAAVDSVLAQTERSLEVIVVDDGSRDHTPEVLATFGSRIQVVRQPNRGPSAARNAGIARARGRWVALLDSDDVWRPDKLEVQLAALERFEGTAGVCFSDCVIVGGDDDGRTLFEVGDYRRGRRGPELADNAPAVVTARRNVVHPSSLLIDRALLDAGPAFDESLRIAEDTDLLFRLTLRTGFLVVDEPLVRILMARSKEAPRLSDAFAFQADEGFDAWVRMMEGWRGVAHGHALHRRVAENLLSNTYLDWVTTKLKRGDHAGAWKVFIRHCQAERSPWRPIGGLLGRLSAAARRRFEGSSPRVRPHPVD